MFLANENFPRPSIVYLRGLGYPVESVQETFQGISDEQVIKLAREKNFIILTFDRDYGELIFRYGGEAPPSVVYFRFKGNDPLFVGHFLGKLLKDSVINFNGAFSVIDENNIRQRFYSR